MLTEATLSSLDLDVPDLVTRTLNDHLLTLRTIGVFSLVAGNVRNIDIFKPGIQSHGPGFLQLCNRRGRKAGEFVQWIEA